MAPSKSITANIISGGPANPNNTKAAKKKITVERVYTVNLKKLVTSFRAVWV